MRDMGKMGNNGNYGRYERNEICGNYEIYGKEKLSHTHLFLPSFPSLPYLP